MTENGVTLLINNDPMEKRNEFIDYSSYINFGEFWGFLFETNGNFGFGWVYF